MILEGYPHFRKPSYLHNSTHYASLDTDQKTGSFLIIDSQIHVLPAIHLVVPVLIHPHNPHSHFIWYTLNPDFRSIPPGISSHRHPSPRSPWPSSRSRPACPACPSAAEAGPRPVATRRRGKRWRRWRWSRPAGGQRPGKFGFFVPQKWWFYLTKMLIS